MRNSLALPLPDRPLGEYTDGELLGLWRRSGQLRQSSERIFLALLPAVASRGLHRKEFSSISHAAAVLGGLSREVVREVLELRRRIQPVAPKIWSFFEQGRTGWTVLKRIVGHLKDEGEAYWLDLLQRGLSRREIGRILEQKRRRQAQAQARELAAAPSGESSERAIPGILREGGSDTGGLSLGEAESEGLEIEDLKLQDLGFEDGLPGAGEESMAQDSGMDLVSGNGPFLAGSQREGGLRGSG
jgi:hypothetical protein